MKNEQVGISSPWWQKTVVYQVYPRSFQDTDGDGVGDLKGVTQRLDYLAWLGVGAVWLSPFYPSPMRDFGYDVTDYTDVDPRFGTLEDLDTLIGCAHALGLRVILDVIPNHTSDEHPWFAASRRSRDDPKRGWYLWRDPAPGGGPPNNWRSVTGGSAWTFDEATEQYYLHSFLPFEPDLDWRNPEVGAALLDTFHFWLARGVDGLRVDMVDFLIKDAKFRDEPDPDYIFATSQYHLNRPEIKGVIRDVRAVVDAYPERVLIGEVNPDLEPAQIAAYYGDGDLLQQPFNFGLLSLPFTAKALKQYISAYEQALPPGAWPNYTLGNHDISRLASRLGRGKVRLAALLLLTLRGTPYLYYGDELGIEDVPIPVDQVQDPWEAREPGKGRDPNRTPMRWDDSLHAGFTAGTPWLPVGSSADETSVDAQRNDPLSLLNLYRRLLELRRSQPALLTGAQRLLESPEHVLMYERVASDQRFVIVLNTSECTAQVALPAKRDTWHTLLTTADAPARVQLSLELQPFEGVVLG